MAQIITIDDIPENIRSGVDDDTLQMMIDGANARASRLAPCLADDQDPSPELVAEAKLILLGAVTRWAQTGAGSFTQQTAGPFSVSTDTRQRAGYNLWPSEIEQLQDLCRDDTESRAFSVRPARHRGGHPPWCSIYFDSEAACSCGMALTDGSAPIYEPWL